MITFSELAERLKKIYLGNKELTWNQNKTEKEFKKRILDRTSYSYETFYNVIQSGINLVHKQKDFCETGDTCIRFLVSKFVLIINKKDLKIITIRDGKWDKVTNDKSCKATMVFESISEGAEVINEIFFNNPIQNGYEVQFSEDILAVDIVSNCNCCVEIEL